MTSLLDYAESILTLEKQAIEQAERGSQQGLIASFDSLRAIVRECNLAIAEFPNMHPEDKQWLQAKAEKASAAISCHECGQPLAPKGMKKRPGLYDHASGCPLA